MTRKFNWQATIVFIFAFFWISACSNSSDAPYINKQEVFASQLRAIPNVVSVEPLDLDKFKSQLTPEQRELVYPGWIFKLYLNSKLNPFDTQDSRTFRQKALVGFTDYDRPNCLVSTGYIISEPNLICRGENEIAFLTNGNFVVLEHRYFGESTPIGMNRSDGNYDGSYWQYLNTKNAAKDIHEFLTQIKKILTGKWAVTGASKGGLCANLYGYYYPDDVDLVVPYVAPLCNGVDDLSMHDFLYNHIGDADTRYQNGKAAEYRDLLKKCAIWILERRDEIYMDGKTYKKSLYMDAIEKNNCYHTDYCTEDSLFDITAANMGEAIWQTGNEQAFETIKAIFSLPNDDDVYSEGEQSIVKKQALYNLFSEGAEQPVTQTLDVTPYQVQAYSELGQFKRNLAYLRAAIAEEKAQNPQCKAAITISPAEDRDAHFKMFYSPAEQAVIKYSSATRNALINWSQTTKKEIIMIYGISDPWYSVRIPDVSRDNVHIFVHPANNHASKVSNFPDLQKAEIMELLRKHLL